MRIQATREINYSRTKYQAGQIFEIEDRHAPQLLAVGAAIEVPAETIETDPVVIPPVVTVVSTLDPAEAADLATSIAGAEIVVAAVKSAKHKGRK